MNNNYTEIAKRIIKEQESIIGPLAISNANKVTGLRVSQNGDVEIEGDGKEIINQLVEKYAQLFGQASIDVCIEAALPITEKMDKADLPKKLITP